MTATTMNTLFFSCLILLVGFLSLDLWELTR